MASLDAWWKWSLAAVGIWSVPAAMMVIFGCCYTEVFDEPPCGCWAGITMDVLFYFNFVVIAAFVVLSCNRPVRLLLALPMSIAQIIATQIVWFFGGNSVSGFYF